jgi:hypothetical protein
VQSRQIDYALGFVRLTSLEPRIWGRGNSRQQFVSNSSAIRQQLLRLGFDRMAFCAAPSTVSETLKALDAFDNIDITKIRAGNRKHLLPLLLKPADGRSKIGVPSPRNTGSKAPNRGSVLV